MSIFKYYVDVGTMIFKDGQLEPLFICWKNRKYKVEKIISVREIFSKAGGSGICYTCRVLGQSRNLFWERNRWFLESEVYDPEMKEE